MPAADDRGATLDSACCVRDTGTAIGRGVFAARAIRAGELVEHSPIVLLDSGWDELPHEIRQITFGWKHLVGEDPTDPAVWSPAFAIALGLGSLFNHANPANLRYCASDDRRHLQFIATIDIAADTQLTINCDGLRGSPTSEESYWFERNGIALLDINTPSSR